MNSYNYNIHGIFSLSSNISSFEGMLHSFKTQETRRESIHFDFRLVPGLEVDTKNKERINIMFYHNSADNSIEFDYPWFRRICAKLTISKDGRELVFLFNKNYLRMCAMIGGGWRPISILRAFLQVNLIQNQMVMVHAGVVAIDDEGILMPSVENTGKTTTVWMLAKRGANFITDEYSILDFDGQCYGIASSSSISPATARMVGLKISLREKILLALAGLRGKILTVHFTPGGISIYPERFFSICRKTRIKTVAIIENGPDQTLEINRDEAHARVKAIQTFEFGWRNQPYLLAYSFFNPTFDISSISSKEDKLISNILGSLRKRYLVSSDDRSHYKFIESLAKKGPQSVAVPAFVGHSID